MAAGTLLGALIGSEVGKSLDRADMEHARVANQSALEYNRVGQMSTWRNPDSGKYCREFQRTITVGDQKQSAYGSACRQPDGSWKIVQ